MKKEALIKDEIEFSSGPDFADTAFALASDLSSRYGIPLPFMHCLFYGLFSQLSSGGIVGSYIVPALTASGAFDPLAVTLDLDKFRSDLADAADEVLGFA